MFKDHTIPENAGDHFFGICPPRTCTLLLTELCEMRKDVSFFLLLHSSYGFKTTTKHP